LAPERYARVKALFNAVCDLAEPERSERLAASRRKYTYLSDRVQEA
jgi:hypothetical protein